MLGLLLAVPLVGGAAARQSSLAASPLAEPPPADVTADLRSRLAPTGLRVTLEATTIDLWWVAQAPQPPAPEATGDPDDAWASIAEGAFVGAMRVSGPFKEIRGKTVHPGVYTLRFGLQPQNGDHLGASPYRQFLLVSPAGADATPGPLGFDDAVAIAKQTLGGSHPASLSVDPPATDLPLHGAVTNDMDHLGVIVEIPTLDRPLRFGLVLRGVIEH